jgi:hypothetical protein
MRLSRRTRSRVLPLVAGAISALALGSASPALAGDVNPILNEVPPLAADATCAPIIVYASRGSSENSTYPAAHAQGQLGATKYYEGLGEELEPIYVAFRDLYAPGTVELVTNRAPQRYNGPGSGVDPAGPPVVGYPAVGIALTWKTDPFRLYEGSVEMGVQSAVRDLNTLHAKCPQSKLLIAGYSEGAEVSRRALARLDWTPDAGTGFVMTFGDVLWKSSEPNVKYVGDTARDQKGTIRAAREGDNWLASPVKYAVPPIPQWAGGWDVNSWCHGGDFACQWRGGTVTAHTSYHREDAFGASARMADAIGGPYAAPVVVAKPTNYASCYKLGSRVTEQLSVEGGEDASASATFTSQWEPFPMMSPFSNTRITDDHGVVRKTFAVGLNGRLSVSYDGHKLDYRDGC